MQRNQLEAPQGPLSKLGRYLLLVLILSIPLQAFAQTPSETRAERQRAFKLYDENKFVDAIPVLEKLVLVLPNDTVLLEHLGWSMFVVSGSTKDPEARKQLRAKALKFLTLAKELGDESNLLETGLQGLSGPDSYGANPLSPVSAAETALRDGEAAHARGDLDGAIKGYKRALELDPKLYLAALFIGDMYFKKGHQANDAAEKKQMMATAGEWFARAIEIDENIETAYRYWGDALMELGDKEGARAKFVDGIIAEPGNRTPYVGLMQWADEFKVSMAHPEIKQPEASSRSSTEGSKAMLIIDPKNMADRGPAFYWQFYDVSRATYKTERFQKDHPGETVYRHSLKEEAAALRFVAAIVSKDLQSGTIKTPDPSLANLVKLFDADLIEAYILFNRADEGIARDYADYKKANREKLRQYWQDFVIAKEGRF